MTRESSSTIEVTVPPLANYMLTAGGREVVTLGFVPKEATRCSQDVTAIDYTGHIHGYRVQIHDRRATVSGNFFGHQLSQSQIRTSIPPLEVILELTGAEWMHDIESNDSRRAVLAQALFQPVVNVHPGGAPGTAWIHNFKNENITAEFVSLHSPSKLAVRLPPILNYAAPGRISEDFEVRRIPRELLLRAHSDIPHEKVQGQGKARVFAAVPQRGEL